MPRKLLFGIFFALFLIAIVSSQVWAQGANGDPQSGIYGERDFRKWGQMNGNLVNTPFINYGMVGNWPNNPDPAEWPKGSGHTYVEGATPIVIAEVVDRDGNVVHRLAAMTTPEGATSDPEGGLRGSPAASLVLEYALACPSSSLLTG